MNNRYSADPKFFNDDGTINFELALAAGRQARSETAAKALGSVWQKLANTVTAARRRLWQIIGTRLTGTLGTSQSRFLPRLD